MKYRNNLGNKTVDVREIGTILRYLGGQACKKLQFKLTKYVRLQFKTFFFSYKKMHF